MPERHSAGFFNASQSSPSPWGPVQLEVAKNEPPPAPEEGALDKDGESESMFAAQCQQLVDMLILQLHGQRFHLKNNTRIVYLTCPNMLSVHLGLLTYPQIPTLCYCFPLRFYTFLLHPYSDTSNHPAKTYPKVADQICIARVVKPVAKPFRDWAAHQGR